MSLAGILRRHLLGIPSVRGSFERGGLDSYAGARSDRIADALAAGQHAALEAPDAKSLHWRLCATPRPFRGTAYEGAGMGLAARDLVAPRRNRVGEFSAGYAGPYRYHLHVGVGLALARRRRSPEERLPWLDPLLGWVAADGYGFHDAFFRRRSRGPLVALPGGWTPFARQLFDQGVGRALWLGLGGDAGLIRREVRAFPAPRQGALWSGLALAAAYAGGTPDQLAALRGAAPQRRAELALGATMAAWSRATAASPVEHTDTACRILTGESAATLAAIAEATRAELPVISPMPLMKLWRDRIGFRVDQLRHPPDRPAAVDRQPGIRGV